MNSLNKNIALIEVGGSHTECMHLQLKALKERGYTVFLICNDYLINDFPHKELFADYMLIGNSRKLKDQLSYVKQIRQFTRRHNINSIVINTLEARLVRYLTLLPLPSVRNYVAVAHSGKYLSHSGTFKYFCRRIKKILVLSEDIKNKLVSTSRRIRVSSFYPIYYPPYTDYKLVKPAGEFWLCAPGGTIPQRKDIASLFNAMLTHKLADHIRIVILGFISRQHFPQIETLLPQGNLIIFETRIPHNMFDAYMEQTDVVLPLIHPATVQGFYGGYKISGSYNLAYAYRKPMLFEESIQKANTDFDGISMSYRMDNIVERINQIAAPSPEYKACLHAIQHHTLLNIEEQSKRFVDFVES